MIPYGLKVATYQKQVHFDPVALLSGGDGGVYVVELTVAASLDCDLPVDGRSVGSAERTAWVQNGFARSRSSDVRHKIILFWRLLGIPSIGYRLFYCESTTQATCPLIVSAYTIKGHLYT